MKPDQLTTRRVIDFATEAVGEQIRELADDPSFLLDPAFRERAADWLADLKGIAADLGIDYNAFLFDEVSAVERERLLKIEIELNS